MQSANPLPKLPAWRPRDGRNAAYLKWYDALMTAESDLDFVFNEPKPCLAAVPQTLMSQAANTDALQDLYSVVAAAAEMWQEKSNTLFAIIKSSLELDGPHLENDLRKMGTFVHGKEKDVQALRVWACSFADLSSIETQTELRSKLGNMTLAPGSDYSDLERHCREYWSTWSRITGNHTESPDGLSIFHMQWLASLPALPEGSILANARKWLADKITDSSPLLADPDETIETLLKYARVIGLTDKPPDDRAQTPQEPRLVVANDQTRASLNLLKEAKCDFCDCYSCESRVRGGVLACICRYDSTFDLDKTRFSDGTKRFIERMRAYHKNNSHLTTLKNVKLSAAIGQVTALMSEEVIATGLLRDSMTSEEFEWMISSDNHINHGECLPSMLMLGDTSDAPPTPRNALKEYRAMLAGSPVGGAQVPTPISKPHYASGGGATPVSTPSTTSVAAAGGNRLSFGHLVVRTQVPGTIVALKDRVANVGVHNMLTIALALRYMAPHMAPVLKKAIIEIVQKLIRWATTQSRRVSALLQMATWHKLVGLRSSV
jgi:hypothetical protein